MKKAVKEYIHARANLLSYFKVENDIYIKTLTDCIWSIRESEGWQIVSYKAENKPLMEAPVSKKNGKPMIYKTRDYTMVVAIDCVKVGFIFRNVNKKAD